MKDLGRLSDEMTEGVDLNITPLIDIVFILLIFFVVTTTFAHELGLPIERPESGTASEEPRKVIRVALSRRGEITVNAEPTSPWRVEAAVRAELRVHHNAGVLVVADRGAVADKLVEVIDACRRAGASDVALGVDRREGAG